MTYPANLEIRNEGTNGFHSCGADTTVCTVFKGPITGWGKIRLTDQGGVRFTSASNTFTGTLELENAHATHGIEIDNLELIVEDGLWTLPKYREMLFIR